MRALCLLLILANVLYFIWSQMIDVQVNALDRPRLRVAEPPPRIVLAREAEEGAEEKELEQKELEQQSPEEARDHEPVTTSPPQSPPQSTARATHGDQFTCTSVGPFANLVEATQAQASLRGAGFQPRQRIEQGELWMGYWVSVRGLETRAAADSALQTLHENGITDVRLMAGADPTYTLSVGIFSDYQRAQLRAEQVRAVGIEPQIEDSKRAGSVYWLDVDLPEPGRMIDTAIFQSDPGKIMRLEMKECPAA